MNVYQYIAENNPDSANNICKKYGYYQIANLDELAQCLQRIVADQQEEGLKDVLELHPDKDTILELFEKKKADTVSVIPFTGQQQYNPQPVFSTQPSQPAPCSCSNSGTMSADGTSAAGTEIARQTNTYILMAAVIVSVAIFSMGKK